VPFRRRNLLVGRFCGWIVFLAHAFVHCLYLWSLGLYRPHCQLNWYLIELKQ
jgi:hypothetical protein